MITSLQEAITRSQAFEGKLIRPEEGEGDCNLNLHFRMESNNKDDVYEDEITINNEERIYTDNEWKEVLNKAIPYVEQELLGENQALEYVYSDLNFIKSIPGTGISIELIPKEYRLISSSGKLMREDLPNKTDTLITAILKYKNRRLEHTIPLTIWPVKLDNNALLYRELQSTLDETGEETGSDKEWILPKRIGDYSLIWQIPDKNRAISILLLGVVGLSLIYI